MRGKSLCRVLFLWLWLMAVLLASCSPPKTPTPVSPPTNTPMPFGKIVAANVPARSGPGNEYDVVGTLDQGDVVRIWGVEEGWYKVQSERFDRHVWVYMGFAQEMAALPASPSPPADTPTLPPMDTPTGVPTLPPLPTPTPTLPPPPSPTLPPPPTPTPTPLPPTLPPPPTPTYTPTAAPGTPRPVPVTVRVRLREVYWEHVPVVEKCPAGSCKMFLRVTVNGLPMKELPGSYPDSYFTGVVDGVTSFFNWQTDPFAVNSRQPLHVEVQALINRNYDSPPYAPFLAGTATVTWSPVTSGEGSHDLWGTGSYGCRFRINLVEVTVD